MSVWRKVCPWDCRGAEGEIDVVRSERALVPDVPAGAAVMRWWKPVTASPWRAWRRCRRPMGRTKSSVGHPLGRFAGTVWVPASNYVSRIVVARPKGVRATGRGQKATVGPQTSPRDLREPLIRSPATRQATPVRIDRSTRTDRRRPCQSLIRGGRILSGASPALTRADVLIDADRIAAVGPRAHRARGCGRDRCRSSHRGPRPRQRAHACREPPGARPRRELDARGPADSYPGELCVPHAGGRVSVRGHRRHRDAQDRLHRGVRPPSSPCPPSPTRRSRPWRGAYGDIGARVVLAPAVADVVFHETVPGLPTCCRRTCDGPSRTSPRLPRRGLLDLTARLIKRWHGTADGRVRIAASPTIPNQATDELLDGFVRLAREHGVGIHTHLAESKVQVIESGRRHGRSIVARLA